MTVLKPLRRIFQLFRDLHCVLNKKKTKKQKENTLDKDIKALINDDVESSSFTTILHSMDVDS